MREIPFESICKFICQCSNPFEIAFFTVFFTRLLFFSLFLGGVKGLALYKLHKRMIAFCPLMICEEISV